ncbi:hypothetical protein FIBSPDRAFT_948873 [Athelia psychrophila]|uniref:Nephrocystin 3-like N-terminal domain-containing protein n=1 Tax=Athelia psychrophila TaxID=1759441 RepID=A0A166Q939_9AGAM|nr:hypothetical protein FIBSPDRAFT_948873 [Fibularhizoctonia sp. CBS 109695]
MHSRSMLLRVVAAMGCSYKELIESISAPEFTTALMSQLPPVVYTLQIISANDLPLRRLKVLGERNVIAKATVENRSVQTKAYMCSSSAEWKQTFQIEARKTSSVMSLQLSGPTQGTSLNCGAEIVISELLLRCRYGQDAELDLRGIKSGLQGRIKIRLSLPRNESWSADEAQQLSLVLSRQPNTVMAATGGCIDAVDGLLAISFPTPPFMAAQSIQNVISKLENFMRIADAVAEVHPYAKGAVVVLSAVYKIIVAQLAIDQSVADLFQTMQDVYSFVDAIEAVPSKIKLLEKIIELILIQTAECGRLIQEYSGHGFAGRCLRETMGASTPDKVAAMAQNLTTLRGQFDTGVAINTAVVCFRIQTDVTTLVKNQTLDKLGSSGVPLAHRLLHQCIPGTRRDVIDEILEWALRPSKGDNSNVFFLHGVAGIGKSAVAAAIATRFSEMGRLGAFVSFERAPPGQSHPSTAVKALALQLAVRDKRLRASIIEVINDDDTKNPVLDALLPEQFDRLIVKPLASIPTLAGEGAIIIVLDGLYECGHPDDWASLLEVLVGQTESLPQPNLRFVITSRTVNGVHDAVTSTVLHPRIKSRELRSSSHSDISAYFTFRMQHIRRKNKYLQEDWQGPTAIAELTARAGGFFPWAVDASNFVDGFDPVEQMKHLLLEPLRSTSEPNAHLDELYTAALNSAGDWKNPSFVKHFRAIMGAIIESPIALSTTAIHRFLDGPLSSLSPLVMATIRRLGSVLSYGPVVQVLHPSFLDFLSSHERCGRDIWCFEHGPVRPGVNAGPATLCLQRLNAGLERNICNMTLSARLTTEVLPEELAYACQFWVDHICNDETFKLREIENLMVVFLRTQLLHWFEAMSILKKSEEIAPMLQRAATWLEKNTFEDKSLKELVIEAIDFARQLASVIAEHPLYVYYVALLFCPSHSLLYQLFHEAVIDPSVPPVPLRGLVQISAEPATLCLRIMNAGLKRNICNMTLSGRLITEVLPEVLAYTCQSWVDHVCTKKISELREMEKLMVVFLHTHLLHWFEAMSLLKKSEEIVPMLQRVATWLEEHNVEDEGLKDILTEAIGFVRKFATVIAEHPLHVYYTALPFCPSHSILYQLFRDALVDPSVLLVPSHRPVRISTEPATMCLRIMNAGLKRNICNIMLSAARLTTEVLPEALAYACQSWVDHICTKKGFESREMQKLTVVFLRAHLLHWFEAMSLLKKSEEIVPMLQRVTTWLEENTFDSEDKSLKDLVVEAIDFAGKFAADITEHPLYVYYTALPLISSHSILYRQFHDALIDPSVLLVTNPYTMRCLALSTNGRRIVSGIAYHVIVRDTATGEELGKMADTDGAALPFSVAFSYDGSRIACGTHKSTVYVWDSGTGARVIGPLRHSGFSAYVNVVAWSTDGKCLLSGCYTGEVMLWNITSPNGNRPIPKIHHPGCRGYDNPLSSLVFSSDGSQIASSSRRGDVHVWDSKTGGIVWSVQEPQGSDPSGGISFLSSGMREFLVVKMKERTQVRDASTGDLCPLPDSLAGAVGPTRDDFRVNSLIKGIKKQYLQDGENVLFPEWVVQGEYFAFLGDKLCHMVHVPKSLL